MNKLNTGDILIFKKYGKSIISKITDSPYTHAAIVVKDPWWDNLKKGLYVIQSISYYEKDVEQNKFKKGVQMEYLNDVIKGRKVDVRYLSNIERDDTFKKNFKKIHDLTYNKPYDSNWCDWLCTGLYNLGCKLCKNIRHKNNFWCSALVGFFYVKLNLLSKKTDWSNLSPADLSNIILLKPYELSEPVHLNY